MDEPLKNRTVLIVEDEPLLRKRLLSLLLQEEASAQGVESISEAEGLLEQSDFDLVLLDINLPDGNGLDLLRRHRFGSSTSVVVMTAQGGVESAVEAMKLGAEDYLVKPFDPFQLPLIFRRCRVLFRFRAGADSSGSRSDLGDGPPGRRPACAGAGGR